MIASRQEPKSIVDCSFCDAQEFDLLLVPGGPGTRHDVGNQVLLDWLKDQSQRATLVTSVCTGSALLAKADPSQFILQSKLFQW